MPSTAFLAVALQLKMMEEAKWKNKWNFSADSIHHLRLGTFFRFL
jgi:hypothetical protein